MPRVKRVKLGEQVLARIKDYILRNNLKAGDRLPTEHELAEMFGVSRISIREATKSLGFLGILRAAPRRGLTVGAVDMDRVTEYLGFHFAISGYSKAQLLRARMVIEIGSLPFAMEGMDRDPDLATRLLDLVQRLEGVKAPDVYIEGDIAFHRALVEFGGSRFLLTAWLSLAPVLQAVITIGNRRLARQDPERHLRRILAAHEPILAPLAEHDAEAVIAILAEQFALTRSQFGRGGRP